MSLDRRGVFSWAAIGVLLLLALPAAPHLHVEPDDLDRHGEPCAVCIAEDAPFAQSGLPASPSPAALSVAVPVVAAHVHGTTPTGGGSRAPPA